MAIVVVLSTRVAEQRPVRSAVFRVGELMNPDRLRHVVPPGSGSTVAHAQTRKHLPGGADVLRWQPRLHIFLVPGNRRVAVPEGEFPTIGKAPAKDNFRV